MAVPLAGSVAPPLIVTPRGVSPQDAARAYQGVESGAGGADFGGMVERAMQNVVSTGHAAENQAVTAIAGGGNLTEVVQAVSRAELALQTTTAIRDRMVSAYQEIMRMPM